MPSSVPYAYLLLFIAGLAASLHCVGMCAIFPWTLAAGSRHGFAGQLLYNFGRLNTLVFIGALSGALGSALTAVGPVGALERALALLTGTLMIVIGLEMLGVLRQLTGGATAVVNLTLGRLLRGAMSSRSWAAPLALGIFNAFLPCQLIYAFAARAASTASVWEGMLTMLSFGLGTVPAMLAVGAARSLLPNRQARLATLSAGVVLLFGIVTLIRAFDWLPHFAHVHLH